MNIMNISNYEINSWHTTLLVRNVMKRIADRLDLDISDNKIADELYWICARLEDWDEDEGFSSSDHYSYIQEARKVFDIPEAA